MPSSILANEIGRVSWGNKKTYQSEILLLKQKVNYVKTIK